MQRLDRFRFSNSIVHLGKQKAFCIMQSLVFGDLESLHYPRGHRKWLQMLRICWQCQQWNLCHTDCEKLQEGRTQFILLTIHFPSAACTCWSWECSPCFDPTLASLFLLPLTGMPHLKPQVQMNIINSNLYSLPGINLIFLACVFTIVSRCWNVDIVLVKKKKKAGAGGVETGWFI